MPAALPPQGNLPRASSGLVDVLDRVLDKGLVIAGDVRISLAEVELLTIRIRLLICSLDKAQEVGLDWWKHDQHFSVGAQQSLARENQTLRERLALLESRERVTRRLGRRTVRRRAATPRRARGRRA